MYLLTIFIGGGLGSLTRFGLTKGLIYAGIGLYPLGTLISNIIASLLLGYLTANGTQSWPESYRLGWMVGFCGGFSTFSTFTADNYLLLESGNWIYFALNVSLNVLLCLLFFVWGYKIGV